MFYPKLNKLILGYCLLQLFSFKAFSQQPLTYHKLIETNVESAVFDEIYDFTYNSTLNAVGFLNRELFGLKIVSLNNGLVIFDNNKIQRNRLSVKDNHAIISPYALQVSNSGRFMFYDFTFKKKITRSNKFYHIKNYLLKEINIEQENHFTYHNIIPLSGIYLKSFIDSDSMIIYNAAIDEDNNTYMLRKRYMQKEVSDSIKLTSLISLNMDGENFWNHDIVKQNNNYLIYYYNKEQFFTIGTEGNVKQHNVLMPHLDTAWRIDLETFDVFEPDYPIIKVFTLNDKVVFYYRSKMLKEKCSYYLSVYNLKTEKTEITYVIPDELSLYQTTPLPITNYTGNQLLLVQVKQGKYHFFLLNL